VDPLAEVRILLAGALAAGTPDGADHDLAQARQFAATAGQPRAVLRRCRDRAKALLAMHRAAVERLAGVLLQDGEVSGARAEAIFDAREPLQEVWSS
jgi:hypothetical protein